MRPYTLGRESSEKKSCTWLSVLDQYIEKQAPSLQTEIQVKGALSFALYNATIAICSWKSFYSVERPPYFSSSIEPWIPLPSNQSYPSGHATKSTLARLLLERFFPKKNWQQIEKEVDRSRVIAGVHYPFDIVGGKELGQKLFKTFFSN